MKKSWEKTLRALLLCPQLLASPRSKREKITTVSTGWMCGLQLLVWASSQHKHITSLPCQIENLTQKGLSWKLAIQSKNITRAKRNVSLFAFIFSQTNMSSCGSPMHGLLTLLQLLSTVGSLTSSLLAGLQLAPRGQHGLTPLPPIPEIPWNDQNTSICLVSTCL